LVARDIEVEFVNFGRSLPQMLDATSASKSTKAHKMDSGKSARKESILEKSQQAAQSAFT
jgi:hypothetical protein